MTVRGGLVVAAFLACAAGAGTAGPGSSDCALAEASRSGDAAKVSALLAVGADPDCKAGGKAPLVEAIDAEDQGKALAVVKVLADRGADVNARDGSGATAVKKALSRWMARKGDAYKEIAKLLLSRGAKLDDHGPAFEYSMKSVTEDIVPLLKPKPGLVRKWVFSLAYMRGDATMRNQSSLRLIGVLLDKGASVNGADPKSGDTLLHVAVQLRDPDLARFLRSRGGDPRAKHPKKGKTPLEMAEAGLKGRNAKAYLEILGILKEPGPRPSLDRK
ncbi:MAG: hypothetical protein HY748_02780 [Elusimicrobia bacterium]|nr:hypothetical protein [Elusimicrobiota bacterium]